MPPTALAVRWLKHWLPDLTRERERRCPKRYVTGTARRKYSVKTVRRSWLKNYISAGNSVSSSCNYGSVSLSSGLAATHCERCWQYLEPLLSQSENKLLTVLYLSFLTFLRQQLFQNEQEIHHSPIFNKATQTGRNPYIPEQPHRRTGKDNCGMRVRATY